ncbi:MAG TPA: VCBS repeat-containing protein [Thermoanaerobaculia bacterium]
MIARPGVESCPKLGFGGRLWLLGVLVLLGLPQGAQPQSSLALGSWCGGVPANPVIMENCKIGNPPDEWDNIVGVGDLGIQGFATEISVNRGETVYFKIKAPGVTSYRLDIYRLGYYGGNGARKIATLQPSAPLPQTQGACASDPTTGLIDCGNWQVSASWPGSQTANSVSGIYIAKAVRTDTGGASHIVFVVRDDARNSDLLFQTSDTTWQAYNDYGGNSLYVGSVPPPSDGRAFKVSYNRPFTTRVSSPGSWLLRSEYPMVRWLEANGYDVTYFTGVDSDRYGDLIKNHKVFLSVGHDEYWSRTQRDKVEAARASGVNLAFFSGNEVFWKTRWEPSSFGVDGSQSPTAHRTLVCYKDTNASTPPAATKLDPMPGVTTGTWRDPRFGPPLDGARPENALTGTISTGANPPSSWIEVPATLGKSNSFWRKTGMEFLADGYVTFLAPFTLGWEFDSDLSNGSRPPNLAQLSSTTRCVQYLITPVHGFWNPLPNGMCEPVAHQATLYTLGTARVFSAGSTDWSWGLDPVHDASSSCAVYGFPHCYADWRMQQATINLFEDMGTQAHTPRLYPRSYPEMGDFNGDGNPDILWYYQSTGEVYLWLMNGLASSSVHSVATVTDLNWQIVTVGDFDGDGKSDLLWRHRLTGDVRIWLMNGYLVTANNAIDRVDRRWWIVGTGDFNHDGRTDILWRYATLVQMWLMNGTSVLQNNFVGQATSSEWWIVGLSDHNGDGTSDILWHHVPGGEVHLWLMNGSSILSSTSLGAAPEPNWWIVGTGDHNGDGKADILWQYRSGDHRLSGLVYVWLMNGDQQLAVLGVDRFAELNWELLGFGDYDKNGRADLLWRHGITGEVMIWLTGGNGNAVTVTTKSSLGTVHPNWRIIASP